MTARPPRQSRPATRRGVVLGLAILLAAVGCRGDGGGLGAGGAAPSLGSPRETLSDKDHGAAAAAVDAMDHLSADPQPDTEVHLQLTRARGATADDSTRSDLLLLAMRGALKRYADVRVAAADGFEELPASEGKHSIHHLSNWTWARSTTFDPAKPTSLLYREQSDGSLSLVGAMYTAPASFSAAQLDQRIPVSVARWHEHVNWCAPKAGGSGSEWLEMKGGSPIYGPESPVATKEACDSAGGHFYPRVFGWMVQVQLVGSDDPAFVWGGSIAPAPLDSAAPHDTAATAVAAIPAPAGAAEPVTAERRTPVRTLLSRAFHPRNDAIVASTSARSSAQPTTPQVGGIAAPGTAPVAVASNSGAPSDGGRPPATVFAAAGVSAGNFRSGPATVSYTRYTPAGNNRHPAIVLIYGDGGLAPQADHFENMGRALSQRGYVVEVVNYFDRTATVAADAGQKIVHFGEWTATIHDALSDLTRSPNVDPNRLGLFGTGLGGTLALTVGSQEPRVRAVVEFSGTLPVWTALQARQMPAVFVAEGEGEKALPMRDVNRIKAACEAAHAPFELQMFDQSGRGLRGQAAKDFGEKGFAFFDAYLRNAGPIHSS